MFRHSFYYYNDQLCDMIMDLRHLLNSKATNLNTEANIYLQYGVMNRLLQILESYITISKIADHNRVDQLQESERDAINTNLNILYINIRAILDNYACAYFYEKEQYIMIQKDERCKTCKKGGKIAIGYKKILWQKSKSGIWDQLKRLQKWCEDMSAIRNQVAHGMPLYVPQLFKPQEMMEYWNLVCKSYEAMNKFDPDSSLKAQEAAQNIGVFEHIFCHITREGSCKTFPIQDTIANDLNNLLKIHQIIIGAISK